MVTRSQEHEYIRPISHEVNWEEVYRREMPRIYNYFRYRVGDGPQAEDLTATTFEKAWRARSQYHHDQATTSTWLFTIACNVALDHYRQHRQDVPLGSARNLTDNQALDETIQQQDDLARLAKLLGQLPDREREIISLKYGAELTNRRIAKLTGLSAANVGVILFLTVRKLRTEWEEGQ